MRRDIAGSEGLAGEPIRCRAPACGKGVMKRLSCRWHWSSLALVLLAGVLLSSGLAVARLDSAGRPTGDLGDLSRWGTVWIHVTQEILALTEEVALPPVELPPYGWVPVPKGLQGRLDFEVISPLPEWAIAVRFEGVPGECGVMEETYMMVAGPATVEEFVPVCDRPVVVNGAGPAPATGLWLELQARPEWTHAPGVYEGFLHLIPLADKPQLISEVPLPDGKVVVPPDKDGHVISELPGPDGRVGFPAGRVTVPVTMTVEPLMVVMTSETEFNIETDVLPGRYYVEPDLEVVLATNEEQWEVHLEGTPFVSGDNEIPLERLEWSRLGPDGEPGPWTSLGESNCIMSGYDERGVFPATFRYALEVTYEDWAGNYVSEIQLVGSPG